MLLAAIDIGTNAVRLFFSNVFEQNETVIAEKASLVRIPIRLGEDVFSSGVISPEKTDRLVKTMQAFKLLIEVNQPEAFRACATSAMREARNGPQVVERIKAETGIEIEIIDGENEANLVSTFSNLNITQKHAYVMFVDVGGGSTEISVMKKGKLVESVSFRIGTVRLLNNKVDEAEWQRMKQWLKPWKKKQEKLLLVGSGGNINKITKLYGRIPENILTEDNLSYALKHLALFTVNQRIELMGLRPDRADVIIPAGEIFQFIMKQTGAQSVYVPKIGLSDGIVTALYRARQAAS